MRDHDPSVKGPMYCLPSFPSFLGMTMPADSRREETWLIRNLGTTPILEKNALGVKQIYLIWGLWGLFPIAPGDKQAKFSKFLGRGSPKMTVK